MFANLRQGSQVYVFHKCASMPYVEMGIVENPNQFGSYYQPVAGIPMCISIRIGEKTVSFTNLPPNAEVADVTNKQTGETITIACNRDAINAEIRSERQKSVDTLNSREYHEQRIVCLDNLAKQLNPEQAEKEAQQEELSRLKEQVATMSQSMNELLSANRELMEQLKGERTSSERKGE